MVEVEGYNSKAKTCQIDGETYPGVFGAIVNMWQGGQLPVILIVGDPGTGKTLAACQLGVELHNNIGLLDGSFSVEDHVHYDPLEFIKSARQARNEIQIKPDTNTSFNSLDYRSLSNRQNENLMDLSRRWRNPLVYDAQKLWRCDTTIREGHNIRLEAVGGVDTYSFKCYRVKRPAEKEKKGIEKIYMGTWQPSKPSREIIEYVDRKDDDWKDETIKNGVEEMEKRRREEEEERGRVVI